MPRGQPEPAASAGSSYTDSAIPLPLTCELWPYWENLTQFTDHAAGCRYFIYHALADTFLTSGLSVHVLRAIKQWRCRQSQPLEESTSTEGRRLHPCRMVRIQSLDFLGYHSLCCIQKMSFPWNKLRITEYMNMLVIFNSITSFDLFPFSVWIIFQNVNNSADLASSSHPKCTYLKMGL